MIINLFQHGTKHFKFLCTVTICFILGFTANAQDEQWNHYYSSPTVGAMTVDTQNIPWFGTTEGIWKWASNHYTYYNTTNSPLELNHISAVYADAQGNKWFGTVAGMYKFDGSNWTHFSLSNTGVSISVRQIVPDNQGNLWLISFGNLIKFNIQTTLYDTYANPISFFTGIGSLAIDSQGNKWVSLSDNHGIAKFDGVNWTLYNTTNSGLVGNIIISIAIDAQNNKWIGSDLGISKFDGSTWTTYNTSNSPILNNVIHAISIDTQGNKWFGTMVGVSKLSGTTWTHYNSTNSILPANTPIRSIFIDAQGKKWFITNRGVFQLTDNTWTALPSMANSGLHSNLIYAVAVDTQNNKWFGTLDGVTKFDGTTWTNYDTLGHVIGIAVDAQNHKWFATGQHGLIQWNGTTFTRYQPPLPLVLSYVTAFAIDSQGNKWLGTGQTGVFKFDGTHWTQYTTTNSDLISDQIMSIAVDTQGNKWFGTSATGVCKFNDTTWTNYNNLNSNIQLNQVRAITVDAQNNKWFSGRILNRLDDPPALAHFRDTTWTVYTTLNSPLQGWNASSIAAERNGTIWLTHDQGIQSFNGLNWTTFNYLSINWTDYNICCVAIDKDNKKWFDTAVSGVRSLKSNCFVRGTTQNRTIFQGQSFVFNGHSYTQSGTYIDTFRRNNLCDSLVTTLLTVIPCTLRANFQDNNITPLDNILRAVVTGGLPPYTYLWSSGATTPYDTISVSGFYQVRVRDSMGCMSDVSSFFEPIRYALDTISVPCGGGMVFCSPIRFTRTGAVATTVYSILLKFDSTVIRPNTVLNHRLGSVMTGSNVSQSINGDSLQVTLTGLNGRVGNRGDTLICISWVSVAPVTGGNPRNTILGEVFAFGVLPPLPPLPQHYRLQAPMSTSNPIEISLQVMKGDSAKPMIHSVLSNPTTVATGIRGNMQTPRNFDGNGKILLSNPTNLVQIKRKSLAVEGLPELDGSDAFQMNLVITDHGTATRSVPQLLAMDVNGDMKIDTTDLSAVIERSLNFQTGFKQVRGDTIAWRHLPKNDLTRPAYRLSATFPNNDGVGISRHRLPSVDTLMRVDSTFRNRCDTPSLNVVGVFLGDADGSYFDYGTDAKDALADTTIFFDGLRATKIGGDTFRVPVYANQRMFGFGLKIENYTNPIQILSVSNGAEVKSSSRLHAPTKRCFMTAYSTNGNGIAANTPLCYVTVKTNCPFPSQFGTMTAYLNGKKANTQVTWNLCTPTSESSLETEISLYPNPATDRLTLAYNPSVKQLSLVNLLGQSLKVLEINASGQMEVDISNLPSGVYFVRVNEQVLKKFVKM